MAELQRLIDEIRCQLVWEEGGATDELARLATDFARACRDVNVRLRRCEEHLKLGLRSEAIHFAEVEPNLLDVVATIDFAERAEWEAHISTRNLPKAEPLLLDVAE